MLVQQFEELLDDVVAVVISDETEQHGLSLAAVVADNNVNNVVFPAFIGMHEALFHDIACKFVLAVTLQAFEYEFENSLAVRLEAILDHMLSNIIAERVSNQSGHTVVQLCENGLTCRVLAVFQAPLNHAASVGMDTEMLNLASESLEDERDVVGVTTLDGFLNDVISVLVLDAPQNVLFQLADKRSLLIIQNMLESLLALVDGKTEGTSS